MHIKLTVRQALRLSAALAIGQGVITAYILFKTDKSTNTLITQGKFLADIVSRNLDNLNEFDVIALRELGLLDN